MLRYLGSRFTVRQWSKKQFVKPEFEVAKRMVGLLYFQVVDTSVLHTTYFQVQNLRTLSRDSG